jgi:hypothetical protein
MSEREWPDPRNTEEKTPTQPGEAPETGKTAGGVDPKTGEQAEPQSSNADIPAS